MIALGMGNGTVKEKMKRKKMAGIKRGLVPEGTLPRKFLGEKDGNEEVRGRHEDGREICRAET